MELPPDNPDSGGELFSKTFCYFYVGGEGFGVKGDGLIGRGLWTYFGKCTFMASRKEKIVPIHLHSYAEKQNLTVFFHFSKKKLD